MLQPLGRRREAYQVKTYVPMAELSCLWGAGQSIRACSARIDSVR